MSSLVRVTKQDNIAIITLDNPPVNALSEEVTSGLGAAIDQIEADSAVKAAVLIGSGSTFMAGADINMLANAKTVADVARVTPLAVFLKIENCSKPVVAALHGTAFGGGLELAMSCHYRVAVPKAQVGQPEVKLGLIPGAAGTQRLPRLTGILKALEMCVTGNPVSAPDALTAGVVDRLVEGELLTGAVNFAREVIGKPVPKTRERKDKLGSEAENTEIFATARADAAKKYKNLIAPFAAIDAVEAATKMDFERGSQEEQRLFAKCLFSDQAKSLIHVFFGEREVAKIPDIPKDIRTFDIKKGAIVGGGTMGGGIAMNFANAGIPVLLKEVDQPALDRGIANIQKNYATSVKRGRFTQEQVDERMKLIQPTLSYNDFADADIVIEAVFEGMEVKKAVFKELDAVCKQGAIMASNTSTLNIDEIADSTSRPESVIGTHFFSPANVMRLLELVRGKASSKEVIATCMQLAKKLKKVAVLVGNCKGFVGNRMFLPYTEEAQFLVEEGAMPQDVDKVLTDFGMAMGPLAVGDMAGLDVAWRIRKEFAHLDRPGIRRPFAEDIACDLGRFGQKTGAGWYKYDENRRAIPDPELLDLIRSRAATEDIQQRKIPNEEIIDRCLYTLINEGARILEEGYALRSVDIDIIYVNGYGFPAYRGGPMFYADTLGLKKVYERVLEFYEAHGELWEPAPLLKELAERGETFSSYSKSNAVMA